MIDEKIVKPIMLSKHKFYKLDENNNNVPCSLEEWDSLFELKSARERRVGRDVIEGKLVSTVWLGDDHNLMGDELHLFETMVFHDEEGDWDDIYCRRYPTWQDAELGHDRACQWVREGCKEDE